MIILMVSLYINIYMHVYGDSPDDGNARLIQPCDERVGSVYIGLKMENPTWLSKTLTRSMSQFVAL